MNLLQYDSDFRSKRFRACELANLSSFEMSLKEKYDVDAVDVTSRQEKRLSHCCQCLETNSIVDFLVLILLRRS